MKKLTLGLMTAFMLLLLSPGQLKADSETSKIPATTSSTETVKSAETLVLTDRLNEINAIDLTTLTSSEKKELRKEVRTIQSELKASGESTYVEGRHGGVYISAGAVIIILLLILIL